MCIPCSPSPPIPVGDLHGDWAKAVGSLRAANVIRIVDDDIIWSGGDTVVVQLGDVLDRGDHEIGRHRCEDIIRYHHASLDL